MINGKWVAIIRYDCAHGFFHRDLIHPNGSKEKKVIKAPDLKYALSFARQDFEDRWEWYKEQIRREITVAFDFIEQIIDNPDLTEKIPEGSAISFIDDENKKAEKQTSQFPSKKYVKVKRHFELL